MKNEIIAMAFISLAVLSMSSMGFATATSVDMNISLLKYSPYPAEPGKYITLTLKIDNSGSSDADNVKIKLSPEYPFYLDRDSTITILNSATKIPLDSETIASIGKIPASQYTIVEYNVRVDPEVLEGMRQISIWHQTGSGDIWVRSAFNVYVQGTDRLEVSNVSPAILLPGKSTAVFFVLNNTGTANIRDVSFEWAEKSGEILPLGSGNIKYASSIPAGGFIEIPFNLVANPSASSGIYNIIANISYIIGSNISKSQQVSIGMFIGGKGEFDVSTQEYSSGSMTLSIANIGETTTSSVSVSVPEQPGYSVTGASSSFIGNMDPGDYMTVTFSVSPRTDSTTFNGNRNNTSPTGIPNTSGKLLVYVTYTDTNGNREIIEKQVILSSGKSNFPDTVSGTGSSNFARTNRTNGGFSLIPGMGGGQNSGSMLIVYAVAGIFLIIIFYIFRKKIIGFVKKDRSIIPERKTK